MTHLITTLRDGVEDEAKDVHVHDRRLIWEIKQCSQHLLVFALRSNMSTARKSVSSPLEYLHACNAHLTSLMATARANRDQLRNIRKPRCN